jgi:peptide/nickel transport system permease protein
VALLGTSLALLNFGIDEFINPRLRAAGLSRRRTRRAGVAGGERLPRRFALGVTPVVGYTPVAGAAVPGGSSALDVVSDGRPR